MNNDEMVSDYTVYDLETTVQKGRTTKIIQIGAVKVRENNIVDSFLSYVNPLEKISFQVTKLTGITNIQTNNAPLLEEVIPKFIKFIGNDPLVGHNIVQYDNNILKKNGYQITNHSIDTYLIARRLLEEGVFDPRLEKVKLSSLKDYYQICNRSHTALADCLTNYQVYQNFKNKIYEPGNELIELAPGNRDEVLSGLDFVQTGEFPEATKYEIEDLISSHGGKVHKSLVKCTNYLLLGEQVADNLKYGSKSTKEVEAEKRGIPILNYSDLLNMIEGEK